MKGAFGQSAATSGFTTGVTGTVASTAGVGVLGIANAVSGSTIGVQGKVNSAAGTALVADNTAFRKIISARYNGVEKLYVYASGDLTTLGNLRSGNLWTLSTNTGLGYGLSQSATGTGNTAAGYLSLWENSDASNNTAVGYQALAYNCLNIESGCTATNNTGVGAYAGFAQYGYNVTGSNNTYIGANAGPNTYTPLTNTTAIGARSFVLASNTLILGSIAGQNNASDSVKVGIGTPYPSDFLTVNIGYTSPGPADSGITIKGTPSSWGDIGLKIHNTGTGGVNWFIDSTNNGSGYGGGNLAFVPGPGNTPVMSLGASGVGIFTGPNPPYPFTICYTCGPGLADDWVTFSSRRFKTNISPLRNALGTVGRLRGVSYQDKSNGKAQIGVIAEEVAEVLPELVGVGKDGTVDGVSYARLTALLIEATKEQQAQIRKLRREVRELRRAQTELVALKARLTRLESGRANAQTANAKSAAPAGEPRPSPALAKVRF